MKNQSLHILLLLAALLCCQSLAAQELSVKSLEYVPNDAAAASYETQMQDINGNFAGVVKVYIALDGVQFEGGGVLKQEKRGLGEYWVWMAQGSNRLKVRAPGFLPLEVSFRAYEEVKIVKPKLTYKLVITNPLIARSQQLVSMEQQETEKKGFSLQQLTINVEPKDANLVINGYTMPVINGVLSQPIPIGSYSYTVSAEGYESKEGIIALNAESPSVFTVQLEKLEKKNAQLLSRKRPRRILEKANIEKEQDTSALEIWLKYQKLQLEAEKDSSLLPLQDQETEWAVEPQLQLADARSKVEAIKEAISVGIRGRLGVDTFAPLEDDSCQSEIVKDGQGNRCALIKVVTEIKDLKFDTGMFKVIKVKKHNGYYTINIPMDCRSITIYNDSYKGSGALKNYEFPIRLESGKMYEMKLKIIDGSYPSFGLG